MDEREPRPAEEHDAMNLDIEGALMDGLDDDPRLGNGVPSHLRGSDLDFIQMSGLTVAGEGEESDAPESDTEADLDMDPSVPVSFYEEGVDDVDSRRAPLGTEPEAGSADEVIVPQRRTAMSSSIESLKEIVADLTSRERSAPADEPSDVEEPPAAEPDDVEATADPDDEDYIEDIVVPDDVVLEPEPPLERSPLRELGPLPEEDEPEYNVAAPAPADVAEPEPEIDEPIAPRDPVEMPAPALRRPDLAQAESLLQRLEAQSGSRSLDEEPDGFEMPEIPEPVVADEDAAETDESVYNRPNQPARNYSKRRRARRRFLRLLSLAVLIGALGVGGYYAYGFVEQQTATDADHYRSAMRLVERDKYAEAGLAFAAFASRYPDSALGGDALLMAAHSFERSGDEASAVRYYETFRAEYPEHPKIHRATTLLALAYVRQGEYEKAIPLLQDPNRRTLDPDGYLASLRALGEAHSKLGRIDEARSAYLRAASLEGNYTADEDYLALAELYQSQAEAAANGDARRRYLTLAVDQWDFAMRSPGITETRRRDIKARRDMTISELGKVALSAEAPSEDLSAAPGLRGAGPVEPVKPGGGAVDDTAQTVGDGDEPVDEVRGVARN